MKTQTKIILVAAALVAPFGKQTEIELQTAKLRNFVSWADWRISGYIYEDTEVSKWAAEKLGLKPGERWIQITRGPIWLCFQAGTPPGNWMHLQTMHRCYLKAPKSEQNEVCNYALRIIAATDHDDIRRLNNEAVSKWLP